MLNYQPFNKEFKTDLKWLYIKQEDVYNTIKKYIDK